MPQAHPLKLVLEKLPLIALVGLFLLDFFDGSTAEYGDE